MVMALSLVIEAAGFDVYNYRKKTAKPFCDRKSVIHDL